MLLSPLAYYIAWVANIFKRRGFYVFLMIIFACSIFLFIIFTPLQFCCRFAHYLSLEDPTIVHGGER